MAARLAGENPATAANRRATSSQQKKVRHRGAIMPRNAAAVH